MTGTVDSASIRSDPNHPPVLLILLLVVVVVVLLLILLGREMRIRARINVTPPLRLGFKNSGAL
eukprot:714315-Pyramimonas_sp.AAC.1